jgi:hypothetical protein
MQKRINSKTKLMSKKAILLPAILTFDCHSNIYIPINDTREEVR